MIRKARNHVVIVFVLLAGWNLSALAQLGSAPPPQQDPLMSLMMSQPKIDITSPVHASASFDPAIVRPGEQSTYRITLNALEESVDVPAQLPGPTGIELHRSAHGQVFQLAFDRLIPMTQLNYRARTANPGTFTVPEFSVQVYGKPITVPAVDLQVMVEPPAAGPVTPRPILELSQTNLLAGQAVAARLVLTGQAGTALQTLGQVQFTGEGIVVDQGSVRQRVESRSRELPNAIAFIYEVLITPIQAGKLTLSAQGFTSRNAFSGPIVITGPGATPGAPPQHTLVESDPVQLSIRPLPVEGRLPGFTGAIGRFHVDPKLQTNTLKVGDLVRMDVLVQSEGNMPRLVPPPPPNSREWQILSANDNPAQLMQPQGAATLFHYTLIPLTTEATATPAIPFSCYDPDRGVYVDLTIPSIPVTVTPGQVPSDLMVLLRTNGSPAIEEEQLTLRGLAPALGLTAHTLVPLQQETWFSLVQLVPAAGFIGLLSWDRRRRYLEQHPDVILRSRARRALRRERRALRHAVRAHDVDAFANAAVKAMRVACSPHYPAEPHALVASDVLQVLGPDCDPTHASALVRCFFAFTDATQFSMTAPKTVDLLSLQPELENLLEKLEVRL